MSVKRTVTRDRQIGSTAPPFESEEAVERKLLYVWKGFLEIYGPRWTETYGNDPLGKDKPDNRREHWLEEVRYISWPNLKAAMYKLRRHQKPNDYWLPDLPTFLAFSGKGSAPTAKPQEEKKNPYPDDGMDERSNKWMLRYTWNRMNRENRSCSTESAKALFQIARQVTAQYREIIKEDSSVTEADILAVLHKRWDQAWIPQSEEEKEEERRKFLIRISTKS